MASYRIDDPFFVEFVYHCIATAKREQLIRVPFDLDKFTKTPSAIKAFAEKASLEQRLVMLSRLGVEWKLWLAPMAEMNKQVIIETLQNYKEEARLESVNKMIGDKHFVFGDRDVMTILGMMAQNCHSETYRINRDYSLLAEQVVEGETKLSNVESVKSLLEDHKLLLRFSLNVLLSQDYIDGQTSFDAEDIMVLQFLLLHKNTFVEQNKIIDKFNKYKKNTITRVLYKLFKSHHIDKFPGKQRYCIANLGVQVLTNLMARVVNRTMNEY